MYRISVIAAEIQVVSLLFLVANTTYEDDAPMFFQELGSTVLVCYSKQLFKFMTCPVSVIVGNLFLPVLHENYLRFCCCVIDNCAFVTECNQFMQIF